MKNGSHQQAISMRKRGWSYNIIAEKTRVSKGTLSAWLRTIPYTPNKTVVRRIRLGPAKSAAKSAQAKIDRITKAYALSAHELGNLTKRDLWMLGIGLYLGEGSKKFEQVHIANSDPKIIKLLILWLLIACKVPKDNIKLRLFAYPDTDIKKALHYWQKITKIPLQSFLKPQIDKRTNKKAIKWSSLPNGTLHVIVYSRGIVQFGIALHHKIMGWIEAVHKNAGIV